MKNLLVELFVEELPPKALEKLGESFSSTLFESLQAQGLTTAESKLTPYASPRRLAVHISTVAEKAADKPVSQKLMPVSVGLDAAGQPTPALLKKLGAQGLDAAVVPQLKRQMDGKAEALFFDTVIPGASLQVGLQNALGDALAKLPIPKVMTYQLSDGWTTVNFVRPAHGLVALHGAEVVAISVLGLRAGRTTQGHRFESEVNSIAIKDADSYEAQLENEGAVIPSFDKRRADIARQIAAAAAKIGGGVKAIEDEALLDEVTALVERPNVLVGQFEKAFLDVPQECLILTMKANQKYFPLLDASGKLTNQFLLVSNITPADPSAVIGGNERVVRPRLADAKFFFNQDRKQPLAARVEKLGRVVYHNKLGTQLERMQRVQKLANEIALKLKADAAQASRAAYLAKADLTTDMVGEFPELQGIMGRYYAQHDGLSDTIAYAIEDHYRPRFAGDELPRNDVGACVALADKLEALAGFFGIGQIPTGDKDPYALRRQALGVLRILIEKALPLRLSDLVGMGFSVFPEGLLGSAQTDLETFMFERLHGMMRELGYTTNEVDAVLCMRPVCIDKVPQQLLAVRVFSGLPEAQSLAAANKRVGNILKKAAGEVSVEVRPAVLSAPAEKALFLALQEIKPEADAAFEKGDYTGALQALAALSAPVDRFFDQVMVNVDDTALKANRLALLYQMHQIMNRVADLSRLVA